MTTTQPPVGRILRAGAVLRDVYEVGELLGAGGVGQVYAAYDRALHRNVALKANKPDVAQELLRAEARALAAIRHHGLLSVYALAEHDGVPFLVMERLYGNDLRKHLARRARERLPMSVTETIDVLLPVAESLAALHGAGLVHRDIKPANVMLSLGGRVVLVDFGLLLPLSAPLRTDVVHGTVEYMAPEVAAASVELGALPLADVYSLGILAFEIVTGDVPFVEETPHAVLRAHIEEPIPKVAARRADLPIALARLIEEMLSKDPTDRPPSMESIVYRLRAIRARTEREPAREDAVLIVEDDASMRRLLTELVGATLAGVRVHVAESADEALVCKRRSTPMITLLDMRLPGTSGLELLMYLRGSGLAASSRFVVVSGRTRDEDSALLRGLGVYRVLEKGPTLLDALPTVLRTLAMDSATFGAPL